MERKRQGSLCGECRQPYDLCLFVLRTFLSSFWSNTLSLSCSWALRQMVSCSISFLWSSFAALYDFPSCQAWPRFVKWAWVFSFCLEDPDPQQCPATVANPPGSTMLLSILKPCGFFLERKRWNINEAMLFRRRAAEACGYSVYWAGLFSSAWPAGHSSIPFNWLGLSGGGPSHSVETFGYQTKTFIPGSREDRIV